MSIGKKNQKLRRLLKEARDLLHHVAHNGQPCPGCDLEARIDQALGDPTKGREKQVIPNE